MTPKTKEALELIRRIFGDTSVPLLTTIEALETLKEEIETLLQACETDLKNLTT